MSILQEIKDIKSGRKELRDFGLTIGTVLVCIGGLNLWHRHSWGFYFIAVGVILIFLGFAAPPLLSPLQKSWMMLAVLMGWVMTRIILSLLYYGMVTPIGLLAQKVRRRFFVKRKEPAETYWITREYNEKDMTRYEKQF